jgi:hypothetical protein
MVAIARWASQPSFGFLYLFVPAMVAALYTQPFTVFAACGLVAWTAASGFLRGERWRAAVPPACLCASLLMFLPWYLFSSRQWDSSIEQSGYPKFHWTLGLAEDVLKGISGGAFLCSLIFLLLVAIGARSGSREIRGLLLSCASFALVGALATDAWKNYFFASRQILFAVPALAIIAAAGLEKALRRSKLLGIAVGGTLLIASLQKDTTMQINAKENWSAAANALAQVSRDGYCVKMAGGEPGGVAMYSVFVPNLASGLCGDFARQSKVALVSNIATSTTALNASKEELRGLGFVREKTMAVGGTTIEIETR